MRSQCVSESRWCLFRPGLNFKRILAKCLRMSVLSNNEDHQRILWKSNYPKLDVNYTVQNFDSADLSYSMRAQDKLQEIIKLQNPLHVLKVVATEKHLFCNAEEREVAAAGGSQSDSDTLKPVATNLQQPWVEMWDCILWTRDHDRLRQITIARNSSCLAWKDGRASISSERLDIFIDRSVVIFFGYVSQTVRSDHCNSAKRSKS